MDQMHAGDKVLFAANCNKHNNCRIWVPNPDKVGTEIMTVGRFEPAVAKTNTNGLCGTGKLSAAVEAQVCTPPAQPVAEEPAAAQAAPTGQPVAAPVAPAPTVQPEAQTTPVQPVARIAPVAAVTKVNKVCIEETTYSNGDSVCTKYAEQQ